MPQDDSPALDRTQRRLLRRIFNGRTVPIVADGQSFLTYKEASRHLASLPSEHRDAAYAEIKDKASDSKMIRPNVPPEP